MSLIAMADRAAAPTAEALRRLEARGYQVVEADSAEAAEAPLLVAGGFAVVDAAMLDRLPRVEMVVRPGAGFERVDVDELRRRGVRLIAARVTGDRSVAEWVVAAAIYLLRRLPEGDHAARAGDWAARPGLAGRSLSGLTMGIVGVGRIGSQVAELSRAFLMRVVAWHPWSDRDLGPGIQRLETLQELLPSADVVSLHCRLEPDTRGLIGAAQLAQMKPGAILVNTGRGGMVDEEALAAALVAGRIGGAAVDTIESEPDTARSPLVTAPRTLLAPHMAGWTLDSVERLGGWAAEAAARYLETGELPADSLVC